MKGYDQLAEKIFGAVQGFCFRDFESRATKLKAELAWQLEEQITNMMQSVDAKLSALPVPKDGERGEQGPQGDIGPIGPQGEMGPAGPAGEMGIEGKQGPQGERGADGLSIKGDPGLDGTNGTDGRDGLTGEPGRDALELNIIPAIDETRSYPRSTYAKHANGLWRSYEKTDGMKGWECIVPGISSVELAQDEKDPRRVSFVVTLSDGNQTQKDLRFPVWIDRGAFKSGTTYEQGDGVSYAGSLFIAQKNTGDTPETSKEWRLAIKRGRDGKDGVPGPRGEKGMDGRAGRDLTQMLPDGSKY